ncbi:uncharacterized protein EKO05_0011069 [Ascochyta rabiei]|uniref:Uncharacterized protein n=1 Tax=Didymella rabiei TaxID=5454 RepID=A0A163LY27_DIDRA|nr:uncharacterized protein EKO05_0011069 [Ascochyta rabiei]KZM28225.1 hypothetical protein ST47_g643 [Ascochyta rabiei]UPX20852.1 hypothetical protein EKO05_0011069 [Ascochyta rabiei]
MMGPQQGRHSRDAHVEAIDLTFSSPEPETMPASHVNNNLRQQQPPTARFKQEPGASYRSAHKDHIQWQDSTRNGNNPQQQPRQINPHHVKQIVDTSSPRALRHIVLQLCKTSPALSGALVRGLAPHSAYAQGLIRGQQARSQAQTSHTTKIEHKSSGQDAYKRMKSRLGSGTSTQISASRPHNDRSPAFRENRDGLRMPSSQTTPRIKREYQASPTDSDDSTNIIDFPEAKRENESRNPTADGNSSRHFSTSRHNTERLAVRQRPAHNHTPDVKPKLCLQCGEMIKEGETNCYYHPGHELPTGADDIPQHSCCGKFSGEPGCTSGRHVSERTGTTTNSKRPSPSPYGGTQWLKKPRVL